MHLKKPNELKNAIAYVNEFEMLYLRIIEQTENIFF